MQADEGYHDFLCAILNQSHLSPQKVGTNVGTSNKVTLNLSL